MVVSNLAEITKNNRWYGLFLKAVKENYHPKAWASIIGGVNSDITVFGYEYTKKHWQKFMDFYYCRGNQ